MRYIYLVTSYIIYVDVYFFLYGKLVVTSLHLIPLKPFLKGKKSCWGMNYKYRISQIRYQENMSFTSYKQGE